MRLLALEWNATEARIAVGSPQRGGLLVEEAFVVPLAPAPEGSNPAENAGLQIGQALHERHIARAEALVAVGRCSIELRQMTVPPAPDAEIPDLVRLQAIREFSAMEEDWLLDFLPAPRQPGAHCTVLAAAIDPALVSQLQQTVEAAGMKSRRIVLRPCAAASLFVRVHPDADQSPHLVVDLLGDEADLTVIDGGQPTFLRTARLPADPLAETGAAPGLVGEIRRTIAAVRNQLGGRSVESIILCGADKPHLDLGHALEQALGIPTEQFDPFAAVRLAKELAEHLPEGRGRFTPLLGMLWDEARQTPPAIDFSHPRRRPVPPSRRNRYLAAGAVALLLGLGYFGFSTWQRSELNDEIQQLARESRNLDEGVARAAKLDQTVTEIEKWTATDTPWLDELCQLAQKLPSAEDAMLAQLEATTSTSVKVDLQGNARTAAVISRLEESLRDDRHTVKIGETNVDSNARRYSWRFKAELTIGGTKPSDGTKPSVPGRATGRKGERRT